MTQEWINFIELEKKLYHPYFQEENIFLKENEGFGDLVDLGCGNARISKEIGQNQYKTYTGVDIDSNTINELNQMVEDNCSYVNTDICDTKFQDETFNSALCLTTYSNFGKNLSEMLSETNRILKPKGIFIGSCYHENALEKRLELYNNFGDIIENIDKKGNVRFKEGMETNISCQYTQEEIKNQLNNTGFDLKRIQKSGPFYLFEGIKK